MVATIRAFFYVHTHPLSPYTHYCPNFPAQETLGKELKLRLPRVQKLKSKKSERSFSVFPKIIWFFILALFPLLMTTHFHLPVKSRLYLQLTELKLRQGAHEKRICPIRKFLEETLVDFQPPKTTSLLHFLMPHDAQVSLLFTSPCSLPEAYSFHKKHHEHKSPRITTSPTFQWLWWFWHALHHPPHVQNNDGRPRLPIPLCSQCLLMNVLTKTAMEPLEIGWNCHEMPQLYLILIMMFYWLESPLGLPFWKTSTGFKN